MMRITGGIQRGWSSGVAPTLTAALSILGCGSAFGPTEASEVQTASKIEYRLLQLSNRERDAAGVAAELTLDETLSDIARSFSREMRDQGFFSHTSPSGVTLRQRLEAAGVDYSRAGEDIAQVPHDSNPAALAHDLLMDSERHRANILDSEFSLVGIGVARSSHIYWITQVLVTP